MRVRPLTLSTPFYAAECQLGGTVKAKPPGALVHLAGAVQRPSARPQVNGPIVAWKALKTVLVAYLSVLVVLIVAALGVVSYSRSQERFFLTGLLWVFVAATALAAIWGWYEYHEYVGWYLRRKLWDVSHFIGLFARESRARVLEARLEPNGDPEGALTVALGQYFLRFNKRLAPLLAEGKERGVFTDEQLARLRAPQSVEQIEANAVQLRTLAIHYRRDA